jgi:hypothetical protein
MSKLMPMIGTSNLMKDHHIEHHLRGHRQVHRTMNSEGKVCTSAREVVNNFSSSGH